MNTLQFTSSITAIPFSYGSQFTYSAYTSCLVRTASHLLVIGGNYYDSNSDNVYMDDTLSYNMNTLVWDNSFPTLNTGRSESSCLFVEDAGFVYAIAGSGAGATGGSRIWLNTIEKLSVSNPSSWSVLSGTLPTNGAHRGTRAVYYDDAIYVLGGCYESRTYWDAVHKIDVQTGAVTQQTDMTLPNEMGWTACSVVSNSIWCAGGRTAGGYLDAIIKYTFPTSSPTAVPTQAPTGNPTPAPTAVPTSALTGNPTGSPDGTAHC